MSCCKQSSLSPVLASLLSSVGGKKAYFMLDTLCEGMEWQEGIPVLY